MLRNIQVSLPVQIIKQGDKYIAYTPAFDLSTSADSEAGAQKRFSEIVNIFIEELVEAGTLEEVLFDLGWQKIHQSWQPPQVIAQKNFDLKLPVMA